MACPRRLTSWLARDGWPLRSRFGSRLWLQRGPDQHLGLDVDINSLDDAEKGDDLLACLADRRPLDTHGALLQDLGEPRIMGEIFQGVLRGPDRDAVQNAPAVWTSVEDAATMRRPYGVDANQLTAHELCRVGEMLRPRRDVRRNLRSRL